MNVMVLTLFLLVVLMLVLLPVRWAAKAVGARRYGFGWCLLALICSSFLYGIGIDVPVIGPLVAFLLSAVGFAAILRTTFLGGVGVAVLHIVFGIALIIVVGLIAGFSYLPFAL